MSLRPGETKIGETAQVLPEPSGGSVLSCAELRDGLRALAAGGARYAVLGIPEDIGPQANLGRGGAGGAWDAFLPFFLNMQVGNELAKALAESELAHLLLHRLSALLLSAARRTRPRCGDGPWPSLGPS